MTQVKTGGVYKYTSPKDIKIEVGTTQKDPCKAVYINISTWITSSIPLSLLIKAFKQRLRSEGYSYTNDKFGGLISSYLTDVDFAEKGNSGRVGNTTYLSIEFTLMANGSFKWKDKEFQALCKEFAIGVIDLLEGVDIDFIFTSYKK